IMFSGYNSGETSDEYDGHDFKRTQLGWYTEINDQRVEFTYLPQDLEALDMGQDVIDRVKNSKVLYLTFDPNSKIVQSLELARFELAKSLAMNFGIQTLPGILNESAQYDLPIVGCKNATAAMPVLMFIEAERTNAYVSDNCIIIETDDYSAVAMKDRLMYGLLGIIKQNSNRSQDAEDTDPEENDPEDSVSEDSISDNSAPEWDAPEGWETDSQSE
ncbi:MAG: hypothetical protein ABIA62_04085, partial [Candidatus Woesearchaeota archaeon]